MSADTQPLADLDVSLAELARRCDDLSDLAAPVRDRLAEGNRAVIMAGVSPGSTKLVAPLAESTLKRRKGDGPPRAPQGVASRVVNGLVVSVFAGVGKLSITKSWPSLGPVAFWLNDGTPKMPARPFMNIRPGDKEWIAERLKEHVVPRGWLGRLFGR